MGKIAEAQFLGIFVGSSHQKFAGSENTGNLPEVKN